MSSTYTIAEVGRRSGFQPSTLRYYEKVGLLPPADRTESGYRSYDDEAVARLRFIARAKQLGCTLEEITDLVVLWDGRRCEPVQARLRHLVEAKIGDTRGRIAELSAFEGQLCEVEEVLGNHPADGACDDACGCTGEGDAAGSPSSGAGSRPGLEQSPMYDRDPSISCTLSEGEVPDRMQDWRRVLGLVTERQDLADGMRLTFGAGAPVAEIAALTEAEQRCCAFFRFALTFDARGTALEVRAPADALALVNAMFESPAP